jgi:hypothetical protein
VKSVYDELSEKLMQDPRLTRRGGPRIDIGLLLWNYRDDLRELWAAADRCARAKGVEAEEDLRAAVERLRPFFGERT